MFRLLNKLKVKLFRSDAPPDFLEVAPDKPTSSFKELIKFGRFFFHNRKYISDNRDVIRKESEDYLRFLEEDLGSALDLDWAGFHKVGHITRLDKKTGSELYRVTLAQCGGYEVRALETIANKMFLRKEFNDRTYETLCRLSSIREDDIVTCRVGTERLYEALLKIRVEQDNRSKLSLHYDGEFHMDTVLEKSDNKVHLVVPPCTKWIHAENELIQDPEYYDLPELDDEWLSFRQQVNDVSHFSEVLWCKTKASKLPKALEVSSRGRLSHAEYGEFGYKNDCVKRDFIGGLEATETNSLLKGTGSVAIGPHIPAALPRFNRNHSPTILYGMSGRIGREPIPPSTLRELQRKFPYISKGRAKLSPYFDHAVDFVIDLLEKKGLRVQEITPEDSWKWLAATKFPSTKKQAYVESFHRVIQGDVFIPAREFDNTHKAFPKNESYLSGDKPQRMILAGSLEMAAVLGPACAILGNYFFSTKYTSKKIPEFMRPAVALEIFKKSPVILNDMSAFEGSIDGWVKEHCENEILKHFFPNIAPWIDRTLEPLNIFCKDCHCKTSTMRCSGDPQTSLGNSLTNLCSIIAAYCYSVKEKLSFEAISDKLVAWVEGDDSLVSYFPGWTDEQFERYQNAFIMMGFATKMEKVDFVGDAGYCSMFFNDDCELCPRVAQTFMDFPWDHNNRINRGQELLYLKASSLHHTCPCQPLTWALARFYSPHVNVVSRLPYNTYEYEEFIREGYKVEINGEFMQIELPPQLFGYEPTDSSRALFYQKYGINPDEQVKLERRILEYGPLGLLRKRRLGGNNWYYLEQLCRVDGINLEDCKNFYRAHYQKENVNLPVLGMRIRAGEDQRPNVEVKLPKEVRDLPGVRSRVVHPLDPYSYHVLKARKHYENVVSARRTHNYNKVRYMRYWRTYIAMMENVKKILLRLMYGDLVLLVIALIPFLFRHFLAVPFDNYWTYSLRWYKMLFKIMFKW